MSKKTKQIIEKDILLMQLQERYNAMHIIRERAQNISLWVLGLFSTTAGWLIQSNVNLNDVRKIVLSIFVVLVYIPLRFYVLNDLNKGFVSQQKVAARIENILGLFDNNESILPSSWKNAGNKGSEGNFFNTNYIMVGIGVFILLLGILLRDII